VVDDDEDNLEMTWLTVSAFALIRRRPTSVFVVVDVGVVRLERLAVELTDIFYDRNIVTTIIIIVVVVVVIVNIRSSSNSIIV